MCYKLVPSLQPHRQMRVNTPVITNLVLAKKNRRSESGGKDMVNTVIRLVLILPITTLNHTVHHA